MEKDELTRDDMLGKLIRNTPTDSPSENFVDKVMEKIQLSPALVRERKPYFLFLKNSWPYGLAALILIVFLMTSDLPFTGIIPGKQYFTNHLLPYLSSLFSGTKSTGGLKTWSIPLMIVGATGFILLLDHFLFRKPKFRVSIFV